MKVTLRQLKIFEVVARNLSFTRAAEELHLSQPAVSMQVKQMERLLDVPLYEMVGKRVHLTEAGEIMYRHARTIGEQLEEAQSAILIQIHIIAAQLRCVAARRRFAAATGQAGIDALTQFFEVIVGQVRLQ